PGDGLLGARAELGRAGHDRSAGRDEDPLLRPAPPCLPDGPGRDHRPEPSDRAAPVGAVQGRPVTSLDPPPSHSWRAPAEGMTMGEGDWLARRFEENRPHLRAVAYRMLGSLGEAEDAVQETWIRLSRSDAGGIENLGGWLTRVVARVCLDMLRSRKSRREEP